MSERMYTVADISKITGYNRSTVTRWLSREKIKNAQVKGNAPLYSAQVLERFKKSHDSKDSKQDFRDQLIAEKNARIMELKEENSFLKSHIKELEQQLQIKDIQIENSNRLVDQAQKLASQAQQLHYLDSPKDESKTAQKSSEDEKQQKKKHWFDWLNK